jgi:hypothetical protein
MIPDELWAEFLEALPGAAKGSRTSIRLFSGEVVKDLIISNRGYVLGREAPGLAGYHGTIDDSVLKFTELDIEAIEAPAFHFWQRTRWVALNPNHPLRRKHEIRSSSA